MPVIRVQARLNQTLPGVGADVVQNTWHCSNRAPATREEAFDDFTSALGIFYGAIDQWLGVGVESPLRMIGYDLSESIPRAPFRSREVGLPDIASTAMPPEMALVMSMRAEYQSGAPGARRRGRIYLGTLAVNTLSQTNGRVTAGVHEGIAGAAQDLLDMSDASTTFFWAIYSSTDATARAVTGGWVDDDFDQQRRRSLELLERSEYGDGH